MFRRKGFILLLAILFVALGGCRSGDSSGVPQGVALPGPVDGGNGGNGSGLSVEDFFQRNLQSSLDFCRTCHIPNGVADVPDGQGLMLSHNKAEDYQRWFGAWQGLGEGVDDNPLLTQASDPTVGHSGGQPWPVGGPVYLAMQTLFSCWDSPDTCSLSGVLPPIEDELPLLGSARGGHLWGDFCEDDGNGNRQPDSAALPPDPRSLVQPGISNDRAVYFNAWYRDCHVFPDIVNEFPHPKTCGDFRASVARGAIIMGEAPSVDPAGKPYRYGTHEPYQRDDGVESIYIGHPEEGFVIRPGTTFAGDNPHGVAALTAEQYNSLWMVWGMPGRPANFDELVAERYGFGQPSEDFPYPIVNPLANIDETGNLTATNGGSGRLPVGLIQTRLNDGAYSGEISTNCQGCHGSQIGEQFVVGAGGGMLDAIVSSRDFAALGSAAGVAIDRAGLGGRVRGTNNAQFSNIVALTGIRSFEELMDVMQNGSTGTGDTPAWWNVGRRPVKFVDAMFPSDAVRVDFALFSPLLTDKYGPVGQSNQDRDGRWTSDHVQDGDHYIVSRKAPAYPLPIDEALAKQGAILFHTKDLWAPSLNNPVPQPAGGNGSCASCHGAYSPRFVHDLTFLADPMLEGIASQVVPMAIIGTDPVRYETYNSGTNEGLSNTAVGYPETGPGHSAQSSLTPEERELVQDCRVQNLPGLQQDEQGSERPGGYAAPPLYGIWATAPYLHNGSVPDVWSLLKSSERPAIWERVSKPAPAGQPNVIMGFDYVLERAYDQQRLGWKFHEHECGGSDLIPQLDCTPLEATQESMFFLSEVYSGMLLGWNITNPPTLSNADIEARKIYNTRMFSQSNGGHTFTDVLSDAERQAIIEYLKTL